MPPIQKPIRYSHIKNALADDGGYNKISTFREKTLTQTSGTKLSVPASGSIQLSSFENAETTKSYNTYNQLRLQGSGTGNSNLFGYAVAINNPGNTIAVGAINDDPNAIANAGRVYIYRGNGALSAFTEEAILRASDASASDNFGSALAISWSGNILAVGASQDDHSGFTNPGSVYVFERNINKVWSEQVRIQASDRANEYLLGNALAMDRDGKYIVAGAYTNSALGANAGAVHVFERTGASWQSAITQTRLLPSDGTANEQFGFSIAMNSLGTLIAVGANQDTNVQGTNAGAAYVFSRSGASWSQTKIVPSSITTNTNFGTKIALSGDGNTLVISTLTQIVYIYKFVTATGWTFQTQIAYPITSYGFGRQRILLNDAGTILTVSSHTFSSNRGSVFVFMQNNKTNSWESYYKTYEIFVGSPNSYLGYDISLSGDGYILVTGAYLHTNSSGSGAGSVYIASALASNPIQNPFPSQYSVRGGADGGTNGELLGRSGAISKDGMVVVAGVSGYDPNLIGDAGGVQIFTRSGGNFFVVQTIRASDAQAGDFFGESVAINANGSIIAIGSSEDPNNIIDAGSVYMFVRSGNVWNEVQKLRASDAQPTDRFGNSVAISADGSVLAITAFVEDPNNISNAGSAYIFLKSGNTWNEVQKIRASDAAPSDNFGTQVCMNNDGSVVVIGAYLEDPNSIEQAGSAYIFLRSGNVWNEVQKIRASDAVSADTFGTSVAVNTDGSIIAVGSPNSDPNAISGAGAVYMFSQIGSRWNEIKKLRASDAQTGDNFGYSVALSDDGSVLCVGARFEAPGGNLNAGSIYVFSRTGNTWNEAYKVARSVSTLSVDETYGEYVSMSWDGSTIIAGAYLADTDFLVDAGRFDIFDAVYNNRYLFRQTQKIFANDATSDDYFGFAVDINNNGTVMAVGAHETDIDGVTRAGAVYMYTRSRRTWQELQKVRASDAEPSDFFGSTLAMNKDGSIAVVGAYGEDPNGNVSGGSAYIFSRSGNMWNQIQKIQASDAGPSELFGESIALNNDGSIIVVGAFQEDSAVLQNVGAAYIFMRSGNTWNEVQKLRASDPATDDLFGVSVAINGDASLIAVGSYQADPNGIINAGSVYIFVRSGNTWNEVQKIRASDAAASDTFGRAVALNNDGSVLIVTANLDDFNSLLTLGSAYIFMRSGNTWNEVQKIIASDAGANDQFGVSVAMNYDGSIIVVGSYVEDPNGIVDAGSAYIFLRSGNTWNEVQKIRASDAAASDQFGGAVAINSDGSVVVIGAYLEDPNTIVNAGSLYIFARSGNTNVWNELQKIRASDAAASDLFGQAVAINNDGSVLLAGSELADPNSLSNAGAFYSFGSVLQDQDTWDIVQKIRSSELKVAGQLGQALALSADGSILTAGSWTADFPGATNIGGIHMFARTGNTWNEIQRIRASDAGADAFSFSSLAISSDGSVVAVGASGEDVAALTNNGAAYIFVRSGMTWNEVQKIYASDRASSDNFGSSVALNSDGTILAVGAYNEDPNLITNAGSVYIFVRSGNRWNEVQKIRASDAQASDTFGEIVKLSSDGSILAVCARLEDPNAIIDAGSVYMFIRSGNRWDEVQKIRASDAQATDYFGFGISLSKDASILAVGAPYEDPNAIDRAGSAYIFARSGNTWTEVQKIRASDAASIDYFGQSVALNGDGSMCMVGSWLDDFNVSVLNSGSICSFKINK